MVKEKYISFETAKLLYEKGFHGYSNGYWFDENGNFTTDKELGNKDIKVFVCQTQSLVMRWLREIHHLYIQIMLDSWTDGIGHSGYYIVIQNTTNDFEECSPLIDNDPDKVFFKTYDGACEAAIQYCLKNLI